MICHFLLLKAVSLNGSGKLFLLHNCSISTKTFGGLMKGRDKTFSYVFVHKWLRAFCVSYNFGLQMTFLWNILRNAIFHSCPAPSK